MRTEAPERSDAQRMAALERANEVRSARAEFKRAVKHGEVSPWGVLEKVPADFETMHVIDLLLATPKYGRVKASKILGRCRISPSKTLGGLSERQRRELLAVVRPFGARRRSM